MKDFHKYPKIRILGNDENKHIFSDPDDTIVIQEKIDGANFRFMYHNGKFIFGSRKRELGEPSVENKSWGRCINYIKENFVRPEKDDTYNNLIFYGENCIRHSTVYDFTTMPPFIGFDIYRLDTHEFIPWKEAKDEFEFRNLPFVHIINETKASEIKSYEDKDVPTSYYGPVQAEGVVFKNHNKQIFAKYVTAKHREANKKSFGTSKRWVNDDTDRMVAQFCTNPRIEKKIFELIHEDIKLDISMMKHLPMRVYWDIMDEHYRDILNKNQKIDVGSFRKQVAKRCIAVLRMFITNNAFEEK